jgi:Zn-dependent protease with chaperone function
MARLPVKSQMIAISSEKSGFFADELNLLQHIISESAAETTYVPGQSAAPEQLLLCSRVILLTGTCIGDEMVAEYKMACQLQKPTIVLEKTENRKQSRWADFGVTAFCYSNLDDLARYGMEDLQYFIRGDSDNRSRLVKWFRQNNSYSYAFLLVAVFICLFIGTMLATSLYTDFGELGKIGYALLLIVSALSFICGIGMSMQLGMLRALMKIKWTGLQGLPRDNRNFVVSVCMRKKLLYPSIGIMDEPASNAFTFGWLFNPRVVVTTGLLSSLDNDEVNAVLAHEFGHVVHWDFTLVALALVIPLLLRTLTRYALQIGLSKDPKKAALLVTVPIFWALGRLTAFLIRAHGRAREFKADVFSADYTKNPASLATSLIKISYSMNRQATEYKAETKENKGNERKLSGWKERRVHALALMGISNMHAVADSPSGRPDMQAVAAQMNWELSNPWSRWHDLFASHPSTARRLAVLASLAGQYGQKPMLPSGAGKQPYPRRQFASELIIWLAPFLLGAGFLVSSLASNAFLRLLFACLFLFCIFIRLKKRYPKTFRNHNLQSLLSDVRASDLYTAAAEVTGKLVVGRGRGVYLEEDGIAIGLSIPWYSIAFRNRLSELLQHEVSLRGWYRHGEYPYFEPLTVKDASAELRCGNRKFKFGLLYACIIMYLVPLVVTAVLQLR